MTKEVSESVACKKKYNDLLKKFKSVRRLHKLAKTDLLTHKSKYDKLKAIDGIY